MACAGLVRSTELLVVDGDCIVSSFVQHICKLDGKVLIDLELHALGHRDNALTGQVGGIGDRRLHRFLGQRGVALKNLANR